MHKLKTVLLSIITLLLSILLIQNLKTVSISFLFWNLDMPRVVLVITVFVLGAIFGAIVLSLVRKNS